MLGRILNADVIPLGILATESVIIKVDGFHYEINARLEADPAEAIRSRTETRSAVPYSLPDPLLLNSRRDITATRSFSDDHCDV